MENPRSPGSYHRLSVMQESSQVSLSVMQALLFRLKTSPNPREAFRVYAHWRASVNTPASTACAPSPKGPPLTHSLHNSPRNSLFLYDVFAGNHWRVLGAYHLLCDKTFGREHCLPAAWDFDGGYLLTSACHSWVSSCSCSSCSVAWPTATGRRCYIETSSPRTYSSTRGESSNWQTLVPAAFPFFLLSPQHYSPSNPIPYDHQSSFPFSLSRL